MDTVRWMYLSTEELLSCVDQEQQVLKSNEVRPQLIDASWYNTLKSFDFAWKDYPIPLPRIRALRNQDPDEVVQKIRTDMKAKHSSFDNIWGKYNPQVSAFLTTGENLARNGGRTL